MACVSTKLGSQGRLSVSGGLQGPLLALGALWGHLLDVTSSCFGSLPHVVFQHTKMPRQQLIHRCSKHYCIQMDVLPTVQDIEVPEIGRWPEYQRIWSIIPFHSWFPSLFSDFSFPKYMSFHLYLSCRLTRHGGGVFWIQMLRSLLKRRKRRKRTKMMMGRPQTVARSMMRL